MKLIQAKNDKMRLYGYTTLSFQALGDGVRGLRRKSVVKNEVRKHENVCFERFSCVLSLGNVIFRSGSTS